MVNSKVALSETLDDVFKSVEKLEQATIDVDISQFLPDDRKCVLTFREPAIKELYGFEQVSKNVRANEVKRGSDIPQELCSMIALLGSCHVSPQSVNPVESYTYLSKHNWRAFQYIVGEFNTAFSYLASLDKAIQDSKND